MRYPRNSVRIVDLETGALRCHAYLICVFCKRGDPRFVHCELPTCKARGQDWNCSRCKRMIPRDTTCYYLELYYGD
jgi:hypothetical protein